jgi:hypothetical protein
MILQRQVVVPHWQSSNVRINNGALAKQEQEKEQEQFIVWNTNNHYNVVHVGRRHHGHVYQITTIHTEQATQQDVGGISNSGSSSNSNSDNNKL